jgi:hypothetical protein
VEAAARVSENTARFIVKLALQYRAAIVVDVPDSESVQELKRSGSYPAGRKALLDLGRLRGLIRGAGGVARSALRRGAAVQRGVPRLPDQNAGAAREAG